MRNTLRRVLVSLAIIVVGLLIALLALTQSDESRASEAFGKPLPTAARDIRLFQFNHPDYHWSETYLRVTLPQEGAVQYMRALEMAEVKPGSRKPPAAPRYKNKAVQWWLPEMGEMDCMYENSGKHMFGVWHHGYLYLAERL